ncbi:MAG: NYN domain-containing protein [Minisyncoccota bacterium]
MFIAKKELIRKIAEKEKGKIIEQLESLFCGKVNIYIDYANVRPWAERLKWHVDIERLKWFLDSFDNVKVTNFYYGTLKGDSTSEALIERIRKTGYTLRTKPVKIIRIPIDASSIDLYSPALLKNFIRNALLQKLELETIKYLNDKIVELNKKGIYSIEDKKCNFDVEIGRDMVIDLERGEADCFVLWSGDSDFHDPIKELLDKGKKVVLFVTARAVSHELNELSKQGLFIFDIRKIKEFICWKRELSA